jgi:hypothetical protein
MTQHIKNKLEKNKFIGWIVVCWISYPIIEYDEQSQNFIIIIFIIIIL